MRSRLHRLLGVLATLLALPAVLGSQQPTSNPKAPPVNPEVVALSLNGVHAVKQKELLTNIATDRSHCVTVILTPICWISKSKYFYRRKYLDHDELKRDVLRIRVFYWKRGFREAQVDTVVADKGKNKVGVTFKINEGTPTLVSSIDVVQSQPVLNDREVKRRLVLSAGSPLNLLRLDTTVVNLQQSLWDKGYADAVVDTAIMLDSAGHNGAIKISIDPRWKATVGEILIEGEQHVSEKTLKKSLTFTEGQVFRRAELLKSQRALYESNLFRRAAIEVPKQGDSSKIIVVTVQEAPLREARLSAGFNTVDFFQVEGRFTHYNFLGGAKRLELQAVVGNLFAGSLSGNFIFRDIKDNVGSDRSRYFAPTYNLSANLRKPWFLSHRNELALGFFAHRRSAPGIYVDRGFGSSATFTREIVDRGPASANYTYELTRIDAGDVYFCVNYGVCDQPTLVALHQQRTMSPFALTSSVDRTNDPFEPSHGLRGKAELEHASTFTGSDFRYNRAAAEGAAFMPFRKRGSVGGHVRLGWVHALQSTGNAVGLGAGEPILHPRKRFYAGGSRSVRGYGENQLGPRILTIPASKLRSESGGCPESIPITSCNPNAPLLKDRDFEPRPLGGNMVIEANAEMRFPLGMENMVGAVFIDGGYVSQRINPTLPKSKLAITPGFGARYLSPVGPIRVDFGINPGRQETLPVVTEAIVNGEKKLVTLDGRRLYHPVRGGFGGILDRVVLHLSIGEAF
ncbi:MAG TPA: BamA/TamA family outer membrane protein [Gemmatimonadaceae bacterium]|nr:BamA/TamA family outer membrane protein [Gemmatimonadaceae bacterium]